MNSIGCRTVAALVLTSVVCVTAASFAKAAAPFDKITYSDSGGFTGGGTGMSLTVSADGNVEAKTRNGPPRALRLTSEELTALNDAVGAVDWSSIVARYITPNASDLVSRDLTVIIQGQTRETHADYLAKKIPPALQDLFRRLDALHRRVIGPPARR